MDATAEVVAMQTEERTTLDRAGSYLLSYLLGAFLLGSLIYVSGVWNFLANTRLLALLIDAGVVMYHDAQAGFIKGVPDLQYFLKSQDPVKWGLVELAALIFFLFWVIKAVQFHAISRFSGIRGTFTQHARAYIEGIGINRLVPFNAGNVRLAAMMHTQGAPLDRASHAIFLSEIFIVFEIVVYALLGLAALGWSVWLGQLFWPLVILGACYLLIRPSRRYPDQTVLQGSWKETVQAFRALAQRPVAFIKIGALSLLAFGLEDIAAYVIAMAFTGTHVILSVNFSILLMGVVGSYIARLIPVTPGGIGQFEWGFAAALYIGGLGLPECVAIAVLDNAIRYASGTLFLAWVYFLRVDYSFEVLKRVESRTPHG